MVTITPAAPVTRHELGTGKNHLHSVFAVVTAEPGCPGDEIAAYERARALLAALDRVLQDTGLTWLWQPLRVAHGATFTVFNCMKNNR